MSEKTLKVNLEITQAKQAIKDLVASVDRLNKSIDQMGTRTTRTMSKAATATRKEKKALTDLEIELKKVLVEKKKLQKQDIVYNKKRKQQISDLIQKERQLRKEIRAAHTAATTGAKKAAIAQAGLNKQVSLGRQLFLRLRSVMLTVFGAYAIIQGVRNTINTIKDFEAGMAKVHAITGATAEEMERLSGIARVLAGRGIFNPTEITEVQVQLAKFGFTVDEISASLEGIIKLSIATGEGLAESSVLVSSAIRALGLSADETTRLVDVLGKSFTSSALDLNKFRESAKYILPLAKQMGWSIEEVTAVLAKLADAGMSGSLAGTGLRQMFIKLWDASSDLSEVLGQGIRTFDDLFDAIDKAKDAGVSFDEVIATIPTRAKTMFTILWNTTEQIREMEDALNGANGAIDEMANIQMNTLAAQMKRLGASWDSLVNSVMSGGGWITTLFSTMADELERARAAIDPMSDALYKAGKRVEMSVNSIKDTFKEFGYEVGSEKYKMKFTEKIEEHIVRLQKRIDRLKSSVSVENGFDVIERSAVEAHGGLENFKAALAGAEEELRLFYKLVYGEEDDQKTPVTTILGDPKEWDNHIKNLRKVLQMEKELYLARNENMVQSELSREMEILAINYYYAKKNLELDLKSGKLTADQIEVTNQILIELDETYLREKIELREKYNDKYFDQMSSAFAKELAILKVRDKVDIQELKNTGATKEELWRKQLEQLIELKKLEIQWTQLVGGDTRKMYEELYLMQAKLEGGFDTSKLEDDTKKMANAYKRLASEIVQSLEAIVDAQVENTERLVNDLDTRIAEVQRDLERETELYIEGYANNVTIKKKELNELQEVREQAIKDREAAVKKQQALAAISQAIDLASAVASTIDIYAKIPVVGLALAAVMVAGFLTLFSTMQSKAKNITSYGEGGEISGRSHSQGGEIIEAEGGEYMIKKEQYSKFGGLVRAINEDNLPTLNASIINSTNFEKGDKVVINNEIWNKMYALWDKNLGNGTTEIIGNKKIIIKGIRKRIINV